MAISVRVDLNREGIREAALTGEPIKRMVEAKAEEVAASARGAGLMVEGEPGTMALPIAVSPAHMSTRARVRVFIEHASGMAVEAKHRVLGSALGGGGGSAGEQD